MEDILGAIERARGEGGTVLAGGERADDEGYLIAPTVFEGARGRRRALVRGGLRPGDVALPLLDASTRRSSARTPCRFGLSASIFTRDLRETQRFTSEIQAGIIHVNSQTAGADVHVPFGGIKGSGWGPHEQGRAAIEFYTETVTVYQDAPLA